MKFDLTIEASNIINDVSTIDNIGQFSIAIGNLIKGDSGKSPYIDETTKTLWEYNDTTKEYEDTGIAAKSVDIYNITNEIPLPAGSYYTLSTAITATPVANRKKGLLLMFESSAGVWETYQFKGVIANWSVLGSWSNDLSLKIDKTAIKQALGTSPTDVMSQKAITDEIAQLAGEMAEYRGTLTAANNLDDIDDRGVYLVNSTITPGIYPAGISTYLLLRVINAGSGTSAFRYQTLMEMGSPGLKSRVWGRGAYNATRYAAGWTELSHIDYYKGVITQTSNIDELSEHGSYVLGSTTATPLGTYPSDYDSTKNSILINMFATVGWKIQLLGQLGKTWMREGSNTWRRVDNVEYSYFKATLGASDNIDTRLIEGATLINTTITPGTYPVNVSMYCILVQNGSGYFWTQTLYEIDRYKRTMVWVRTGHKVSEMLVWNTWVEIANKETPEPVDPSQPLFGKKMVFFGDSITNGAGGLNNYPQYVATRTGATITNVGIGGTQMANHVTAPIYNPFSFCNLVTAITTNVWTTQDANASAAGAVDQLGIMKSLDLSSFDFLLIAYGANDRSNGIVVGAEASADNDEFYGALNNSINTLMTAYPNLHIIYIAPYDRPSAPDTMQPFTDAVINVAQKNAMPVLDLLRTSGINSKTASYYLEDGLHPKLDFGYEFLGNKIGGFILSVV